MFSCDTNSKCLSQGNKWKYTPKICIRILITALFTYNRKKIKRVHVTKMIPCVCNECLTKSSFNFLAKHMIWCRKQTNEKSIQNVLKRK